MPLAVAPLGPEPRFDLIEIAAAQDDFAHDVREGLTAARKTLPPRWFYDALGSALFDAICFLPEYYVMRAEAEVLTTHRHVIVDALVDTCAGNVRLMELGSGAARKTRILLDVLTERQSEVEYVPVDVDTQMLERSGRELLNDYANLRVLAVSSDFTRPSIPLSAATRRRPASTHTRTIVLFLGSTIGNLDPDAAVAMLRDLRQGLSPGDAFFL